MNVLDLFAGIGGFSLGMERAGHKAIGFCEIDERCQKILAKHWPHVKLYEDVRELNYVDKVEIITAGFPCPDTSIAGNQAGLGGERSGLWSEVIRITSNIRPEYLVVENVPNLLTGPIGRAGGWFGRILSDLAQIGFDAEWHCIPSSSVGAPCRRDRIFLIAFPQCEGGKRLVQTEDIGITGSWGWCGKEDLRFIGDNPFKRGDRWPKPIVRGMDARIPGRMDRLKAIGNSVNPHIAEIIGRSLWKYVN